MSKKITRIHHIVFIAVGALFLILLAAPLVGVKVYNDTSAYGFTDDGSASGYDFLGGFFHYGSWDDYFPYFGYERVNRIGYWIIVLFLLSMLLVLVGTICLVLSFRKKKDFKEPNYFKSTEGVFLCIGSIAPLIIVGFIGRKHLDYGFSIGFQVMIVLSILILVVGTVFTIVKALLRSKIESAGLQDKKQ